jgi:cytochrome c oxidase cbb3-type subunit III
MMHNEKEPLLMDHDADGITELDNNLPSWWVWLFFLCCVWALGYMIYFHAMGGPGQIDQYENEMAAAKAALPVAPEPVSGETAAAVVMSEPSKDEAVVSAGKELFMKNCLVCHGPDGGGLIGPNMCDDYWIHGPKFSDNVRTIEEGVLAKGMISWKAILKPDEIYAVASYIYTLRGTTPAMPKAPEGEREAL